jgi:hypothetical protein
MLQNTPVERLKSGGPTTGLPSGRLVTKLNTTFRPTEKTTGWKLLDEAELRPNS